VFETKPVILDLAELLYARAGQLDRGDVLRTEEVEVVTGCVRYEDCWTTLLKKFRRLMLDRRHIALWPVPGVGYRLCTKDEQLNLITVARQRRAARQLSRSLREVGAMPNRELTLHQQRVRALKVRQMLATRRQIKAQVREQERTTRRSDTPPPRPVPGKVEWESTPAAATG
jgi:hypothetical protein